MLPLAEEELKEEDEEEDFVIKRLWQFYWGACETWAERYDGMTLYHWYDIARVISKATEVFQSAVQFSQSAMPRIFRVLSSSHRNRIYHNLCLSLSL